MREEECEKLAKRQEEVHKNIEKMFDELNELRKESGEEVFQSIIGEEYLEETIQLLKEGAKIEEELKEKGCTTGKGEEK